MHFFIKLKIISLSLPLTLKLDALINLFCRFHLVLIDYMQDRHNFLPMAHYLFFPEMVVLCPESSLPCHFCPIALVARPPAIYLLPFLFLGKFVSKNTKIFKNPKKSFLTVFSTECRFAFSYSVTNFEKDTECFCLTFILVKHNSKWDQGSLYKFNPHQNIEHVERSCFFSRS